MTTGEPASVLARHLQQRIQGEVRFDRYSRALYSTDASIYQMEPVGVAIPRSVEDVHAIVELGAREGVAVLPRGAGTSLAGQTVNHALVLDFSKYLNRVLEINPEERWARVQPGITLAELNRQLRPFGLHFGPDPATADRATIGGAIGNNSCGSHSIVYGKTSDQVLALEAVLSDAASATFTALSPRELEHKMSGPGLEGEIYRGVRGLVDRHRDEVLRRYPRIMRRVSGYNLDHFAQDRPFDLAQLAVGSEGTLATTVSATVRLQPLPAMRGMAVLHFRDIVEAMEATVAVLEHGPAAVELMDRMLIEGARSSPGFARLARLVRGDPAALLVVEFFGESEAELQARLATLERDISRRRLGYSTLKLLDPRAQSQVWTLRRAGLGLLMSMRGDVKPLPFVEDTAVPPEVLPDYVRRFDKLVRAEGTVAAYYGHASVGCLHIRPLVNLKVQEGVDRMVGIARSVGDLVLEYEGSLSGEHGDGIVRGVWTEKMFGTRLYNAFRDLKRIFDPQGIMNPGKIVDCPPMTENLRVDPQRRAMQVRTVMDFSEEGGLSGAVELCNGQGACRKMLGGTMCPSYMVTGEEEHSTRGRANALRAVLSGRLPPDELTGQRLHDVLDLCLGCKGCRGECPSTVDMARLKAEVEHRRHRMHGLPPRTRLFGHIAAMNAVGARFAPLTNWTLGLPLVRRLLARVLHIDSRRRLPPVVHHTFERWFQAHEPGPRAGLLGRVVFMGDTFTNYHVPEVGRAAVRVLEALGYEVVLPQRPCCGRTMISGGMLDEAQAHARANVDALYPYVADGIPVVGCEPSCLLTLRDEYPALLPGDPRVQEVARKAFLLEELLLDLQGQGKLDAVFGPLDHRVLFHGHCHQKALVGSRPSLEALALVPELEVSEVDSGCCGMAGAFGYESEHYDISMAIGRRRLFPAVEGDPDALVVANGFSCRTQVEDATGRRPLHVAEVLTRALQV